MPLNTTKLSSSHVIPLHIVLYVSYSLGVSHTVVVILLCYMWKYLLMQKKGWILIMVAIVAKSGLCEIHILVEAEAVEHWTYTKTQQKQMATLW